MGISGRATTRNRDGASATPSANGPQPKRPLPDGDLAPINPKKKKRYSSSSSIFSLKYKPNDLLQLDLVKESSTWIRIFEFMMTYPEVFATLTNPTQSQKYSKKSPTKERRNINLKIDTQFTSLVSR